MNLTEIEILHKLVKEMTTKDFEEWFLNEVEEAEQVGYDRAGNDYD